MFAWGGPEAKGGAVVFYMAAAVAAGRAITLSFFSRMRSMGTGRRLLLGLCGLLLASGVAAAVVDGLYDGVVPGDGASAARPQVAADALRQVVVRITGVRAAATDPALGSLYADALRLAQSYRAVPGGQVAVGFDAATLDAALLAAGQRLWPRERVATLVLIVTDRPGVPPSITGAAEPDLRRDVEHAAAERGVPLVWANGLEPAALAARIADVQAGHYDALRALAHERGADGLLVGRVTAAGGSWTWVGPAGNGAFAGPAGEAVQLLADRYGAVFAVQSARSSGSVRVAVRAVHDLAGFATATQLLGGLGMVHSLAVDEVSADTLWLRLAFSGEPESLRQAALGAGRLGVDSNATADGAMHFVLMP